MTTYRVSHRKQGTSESVWRLKISGAVSDQFRTKSNAVSMAKRLARQDDEKSKVVIERKNGSVQNTVTYSGSDQSVGLSF